MNQRFSLSIISYQIIISKQNEGSHAKHKTPQPDFQVSDPAGQVPTVDYIKLITIFFGWWSILFVYVFICDASPIHYQMFSSLWSLAIHRCLCYWHRRRGRWRCCPWQRRWRRGGPRDIAVEVKRSKRQLKNYILQISNGWLVVCNVLEVTKWEEWNTMKYLEDYPKKNNWDDETQLQESPLANFNEALFK